MVLDETQSCLKPCYVPGPSLGPLSREDVCSEDGAKRDKISNKNHPQDKGREGQGEVLAGELESLFSDVTQTNTHCFKFSSRYSMRLPSYRLPKNSLRNLLKGCNTKKSQNTNG